MPPSTNALYARRKGGGIALTDAARDYKNDVKKLLRREILRTSRLKTGDRETIYEVEYWVYLKKANLENEGWFEFWTKTGFRRKDDPKGRWKKDDVIHYAGERKAKSRYKEIDTDNRIKFAQDCMVKSLNIPSDAQVFDVIARKRPTNRDEHLVVKIRVMGLEEVFGEGAEDGDEES